VAGTWTALIYGLHTTAGFNGQVNFEFKTTRYTNFGSVSGSLQLAPGQSGTLHVNAKTPAKPGDLPAAVEVDTAAHQHFAVRWCCGAWCPTTATARSPVCCRVATAVVAVPRRPTRSASTCHLARRTSR